MKQGDASRYPVIEPTAVVGAMCKTVAGIDEDVRSLLTAMSPVSNGACELVVTSGIPAAGLTFRGEHEPFVRAVCEQIQRFGRSATELADYAAAARQMGHRRGVVKFEWDRTGGALERRVMYYFRQRVAVREFQASCRSFGIEEPVVRALGDLADLLGCHLVHVPARAMCCRQPVHRMYLAEHEALARSDIAGRVAALARFVGARPTDVERVIGRLGLSVAPDQPRLVCVAVAFTGDRILPGLKLYYRHVGAAAAARIEEGAGRRLVEREVRRLCAVTGRRVLTHLGLRFGPDGPLDVKYYAEARLSADSGRQQPVC